MCLKVKKHARVGIVERDNGDTTTYNFLILQKDGKKYFQCMKYDGKLFILLERIQEDKNGTASKFLSAKSLLKGNKKYTMNWSTFPLVMPVDESKYSFEEIEGSILYSNKSGNVVLLKSELPNYSEPEFPNITTSNEKVDEKIKNDDENADEKVDKNGIKNAGENKIKNTDENGIKNDNDKIKNTNGIRRNNTIVMVCIPLVVMIVVLVVYKKSN